MILKDLKTLYQIALSPIRGDTHAQRLENFYSKQSAHYDAFRLRLLKGRKELIEALEFPESGVWLDLGCGTGANLEWAWPKLSKLKQAVLVDLSPSLLKVAESRIQRRGWQNVKTIQADATSYIPEEAPDLITFSYSLSMIPDWFAAIEHAKSLLKPGGKIGVVDFYVSRKYESQNRSKHSWVERAFWSNWFGFDNVFLSGDHIPYLQRQFKTDRLLEGKGKVPYLPLLTVPTYQFIGTHA